MTLRERAKGAGIAAARRMSVGLRRPWTRKAMELVWWWSQAANRAGRAA